jgi:hypothetical protein
MITPDLFFKDYLLFALLNKTYHEHLVNFYNLVPHSAQNISPLCATTPQFGQTLTSFNGVAHSIQNWESNLFLQPHLGQTISSIPKSSSSLAFIKNSNSFSDSNS